MVIWFFEPIKYPCVTLKSYVVSSIPNSHGQRHGHTVTLTLLGRQTVAIYRFVSTRVFVPSIFWHIATFWNIQGFRRCWACGGVGGSLVSARVRKTEFWCGILHVTSGITVAYAETPFTTQSFVELTYIVRQDANTASTRRRLCIPFLPWNISNNSTAIWARAIVNCGFDNTLPLETEETAFICWIFKEAFLQLRG